MTGTAHQLRLFTMNISGPSLSRASVILGYLSDLDPDLLVLTETRGTPGTDHLLNSYRRAGYQVIAPVSLASAERGVAVVHRLQPAAQQAPVAVDLAHRLAAVHLGSERQVTLVGTYVPSRDASREKIERKQTFLAQMLGYLRALVRESDVILMGDFNVVDRSHQPRYPSFRAWEYDSFDHIATCELVDAFTELNPGVIAHTWIGRKGDGYRYDYAFVSRRLLGGLQTCDYIDEPRRLRLTDHAGQLLSIKVPGVQVTGTPPPVSHAEVLALAL